MRRSLTAGLFGLCLVGAASAQSYGYNNSYGYNQNTYQTDNCAKQRRDGQTGGAIVGGLLGALAGGAIGNNIDGDDDRYYRRGYRGYRGYRGHRGYGYGHGGYGYNRH